MITVIWNLYARSYERFMFVKKRLRLSDCREHCTIFLFYFFKKKSKRESYAFGKNVNYVMRCVQGVSS